jgi:hypothetical protein
MSNSPKAIAQRYFDAFFSGGPDLDAVGALLTDDFRFSGPLMSADSAEDFIAKLRGMGGEHAMRAELREAIAEGERVVLLYDFLGPGGSKLPFFEAYRIRGEKICEIELSYDPRPMIEMMP